jgi:ABC-2 type transport system permease protein
MFHLLKIEWLKVKNYRTFWILLALYILSMGGFNYIIEQIYNTKPRQADMLLQESPYKFPELWQTLTYFSSFLTFIPGLLMILLITNEYSFKTHRQNVIDGMSRTQFVLVKMVVLVLLALLATLIVLITTLLFGAFNHTSPTTANAQFIIYFFIQALSYSFVALLLGLLFRRSGLAIGVYFLYVLVFDELIAQLLKKYVGLVGYYMPLESNDVLITVPFGKRAIGQLVHRPEVQYLLIAAVAWLIVYFFVSKRKFETADL